MATNENMRRSVSIPDLARMHPISEALLYRLAGESRLP